MSAKPLYLAGPMTGYPQFNFPAFHAAAAELRGQGFAILSPAELDLPEVQEAALASSDGKLDGNDALAGHTHGSILARDVDLVANSSGGVVLLAGWERSRGARMEVFTALTYQLPVYVYVEAFSLQRIEPSTALRMIVEAMGGAR